jgi:hypothetical protein
MVKTNKKKNVITHSSVFWGSLMLTWHPILFSLLKIRCHVGIESLRKDIKMNFVIFKQKNKS